MRDFEALAMRLADAAGAEILKYWRQPIDVDDKADDSPVTIADREAERVMRALINQTFPDHGILGEEFGNERLDASHVWVLDPVDGTRSFITGMPCFGTLIGLWRAGQPVLGVIDQPVAKERWLGLSGGGCTLNGKPVRVRPCPDLNKAALHSTGPEIFKADQLARFERLRKQVKLSRGSADCYAYALLATGFVDLVCEAGLKPFDYAAIVPVVEAAGGVVTDWQGQPLNLQSDGSILAAGDSRAHAQALEVLNS
ncbi:Inositol monophosphatase [Rhodospirillaceae bacterium LM-1]|nr:Inositol monophosphatase [Rhodospirillaceae bacterium LM-1]